MKRALVAFCLASCAGAVASRPQWLVTIATDAPIPQLGDRVLVEILDERGELACGSCRRLLGAGDASRWPMSFGVDLPASGRDLRIRARLFRVAATAADGLPPPAGIIDALGLLPSRPSGIAEVTLSLHTDCFDVPSDPVAGTTCDAATRTLVQAPILARETSLAAPGSWPHAAERPCTKAATPGVVCIPGGAFLLGDSRDIGLALPTGPERLVVLSPFGLDRDEITVGEVRRLRGEGRVKGAPIAKREPGTFLHACTYLSDTDAVNDALPIVCVSHALAEEVCAARGMRLPTEAEWEYAAGNRGRESTFPWGDDLGNACDHAIVERGRTAFEPPLDGWESCRLVDGRLSLPWGPAPGGHAADVTALGLRNMAGNVMEWAADRRARYDDPCWMRSFPLIDPVCRESSRPEHVARGAGWSHPAITLSNQRRGGGGQGDPTIGFRCAISL